MAGVCFVLFNDPAGPGLILFRLLLLNVAGAGSFRFGRGGRRGKSCKSEANCYNRQQGAHTDMLAELIGGGEMGIDEDKAEHREQHA
jgi:hypothetical protein